MILTCPSCTTRYLIDPTALGDTGRLVRCARCAHSWLERPPKDMPKPVDVLPPPEKVTPLPPGSNLPALNNTPRSRRWMGWAALAVVVVGLAAGGYFARDKIVGIWPSTDQLFGSGDTVATVGLKLRNVNQSTSVVDDQTVVNLTGEIVNISDVTLMVPKVIADIMDKDRNVIRTWVLTADIEQLMPGEKTGFNDDYADPPKNAVQISVHLEGVE